MNYTLEADVPYTFADASHPIMQGMTPFTIKDEAFFNMTWAKSPEIHVLATAVMAKTQSAGTHAGEVVPQIWTYENSLLPGAPPFRAFVWMQGHNYVNFSHPQIQPMLLRGIAWAAKYPADALATERPQGRGRGRGTGTGEELKPVNRVELALSPLNLILPSQLPIILEAPLRHRDLAVGAGVLLFDQVELDAAD